MKYLKFINRFFIVAAGVVIFSCIEPFTPDIGTDDYNDLLVVEGLITNKPGPFRVKLSYSIPLDTIQLAEPVYGANVIIYDDRGGEYQLFNTDAGWYESASKNLTAIVGVNYTLSIVTPDGKNYESTSVALEPGPEIDKVHYKEVERTNFDMVEPTPQKWLDILVDVKGVPGKKSYLKWNCEEIWKIKVPYSVRIIDLEGNESFNYITPETPFEPCWASDISSSITLGSSDGFDENEIINVAVKSIAPNNTRLHIAYSILVKQLAMNKEMYDYWSMLEEVNENSGSMFDKMPISIYGNISCCDDNSSALGYFMVADYKEERIFILPHQHSLATNSGFEGCYYTEQKQNGNDFYVGKIAGTEKRLFQGTFECIDCGDRGTKEKPPFWK